MSDEIEPSTTGEGMVLIVDPGKPKLTPEERAQVDDIKRSLDVTDAQAVVQYGLPAQARIATFSDTLLNDVRNKDTGETGEALAELVHKQVREFLDIALRVGAEDRALDHAAQQQGIHGLGDVVRADDRRTVGYGDDVRGDRAA